jgi:hypothetical protein
MRKKLQKTFGENLEVFELAKLKNKYEELGFIFYTDHQRIGKGNRYLFDAFAKNPLTNEEIIFEIKSAKDFRKGDTERVLQQRDTYLKLFPRARFVLVLAKEPVKPNILDSAINDLLLKFIEKEKLKDIMSKIDGFIKLNSLTDISINNLDFADFRTMNIKGYANLKFWIQIEDNNFRGESLSDGLPFAFDINLIYSPNEISTIYKLEKESKIDFDFSEFS